MIKKICNIPLLLLINSVGYSQSLTDTVPQLKEVVVTSYFSEQPVMRLPASISVIDSKQLENHPPFSLVPAINAVPGVRIEERSPGSYRLSIRGSLLRSPFGIRNVKMYIDEFPLTDAGGNTYLNLLDAGSLSRLEILKGPEASIFGANSGGVIKMSTFNPTVNDSASASALLSGGSYGSVNEHVALKKQWKNYRLDIYQAAQKSDGYRDNSALKRDYFHVLNKWNYSQYGTLQSLVIFSDLNYRTPGGLTLAQMQQNPRAARPATAKLSGAEEQKAGIENSTMFGGISNEIKFSDQIRHVVSVFGSKTAFDNPFITNYEYRDEKSAGFRTYLELKSKAGNLNWNWQTGVESQITSSRISQSENEGGLKVRTYSADQLKAYQTFFFTHFSTSINNWMFEAAGSLNNYHYKFGSLALLPELNKRKFSAQIMPRVALSYSVTEDFTWRASASRGYSPPTLAEILPSNNIINTDLQPENGWNYETGFRFRGKSDRYYIDAVVFDYRLKDAIVRRQNENSAEYFINAGGTKQLGVEVESLVWLLKPVQTGLVRGLQLRNSFTYSNFSFTDYQIDSVSYSGNKLTGVPQNVVVSSLDLDLFSKLFLFVQHNYTSSLPLNDANSISANSYHLMQLKAGWRPSFKSSQFEIFGGADNLLNKKYSLGNDLNAFGGRYYNPAPIRNFYFGIAANFH